MKINQSAPVVQTNQILIHASPEKIWQVLTNINQWDSWNAKIKKPSLKEPLKTNNTFTWKTNGSKIKSTIHTIQPYCSFGWTGKALGAKAIHNWTIEPTKDGTLVKVEESMEGWIVSLMKKKMNQILANDMLYWLEQLKASCEN